MINYVSIILVIFKGKFQPILCYSVQLVVQEGSPVVARIASYFTR